LRASFYGAREEYHHQHQHQQLSHQHIIFHYITLLSIAIAMLSDTSVRISRMISSPLNREKIGDDMETAILNENSSIIIDYEQQKGKTKRDLYLGRNHSNNNILIVT
jgi:hypothetical protein